MINDDKGNNDQKPAIENLLVCNSSTRIRSKDVFMLMALWMELFPSDNSSSSSNKTGALLVSPLDKVISLEHTGEAHAIVRALLSATLDTLGCDVFVSRFPCSLCTKIMVQAGIRKCYYFPAEKWECYGISNSLNSISSPTRVNSTVSSNGVERNIEDERFDKNEQSVFRLIKNNSTALSLYIPQWSNSLIEIKDEISKITLSKNYWKLADNFYSKKASSSLSSSSPSSAAIAQKTKIKDKFERTMMALEELESIYANDSVVLQTLNNQQSKSMEDLYTNNNWIDSPDSTTPPAIVRHAIVLSHIAARRTDDPKVGVGAVIILKQKYISVGWNGFPQKAQNLDYPHGGADDNVEDEELKYAYSLHAEQNALLWRNPFGCMLDDGILVTTKLPCDECSPMVCDSGIKRIYTNRQKKKKVDDPARLRGLSYEKVHRLMDEVWVFKDEERDINVIF